jgi:Flp pilus assembly pilin Flp
MRFINFFAFDAKGGGLVEYLLIVVLIALASMAVMTTHGAKVQRDMAVQQASL